jgi:hypothetical protein
MADFVREVLKYYDKSYLKTLGKKHPGLISNFEISEIPTVGTSTETMATKVVDAINKLTHQPVEKQ